MKKNNYILLAILLVLISLSANARTFVHQGGLHSMADLDRMKAKVAAKEHSNGQKVFSAKTSGSEYLLDMKNMSFGIYLLRIRCDNKLAIKKIIKK